MRLYQKQYQVMEAFESLPRPGELVEEIQTAPYYRIDENQRRAFSGGQFSLTIEGEGIFQNGNEITSLRPGDGFLALHGERDVSYYFPPDGEVPWVFLWISFLGEAAELAINEINERHGHIFRLDTNEGLVTMLRSLVRRSGLVALLDAGNAAELCARILGALIDSKSSTTSERRDDALTAKFQEFVIENVRRDFGVNEAAEAVGVSREHLTRVVSHRMGTSPAAYIRERRMREARHLLLETNLACSDISDRLGFASPSGFSRIFKSVIGVSPERYRSQS